LNRRIEALVPAATASGIVAAVVRPEILALTKYAVAKAPGLVKLDAMESPFPLPEPVRA
jgi:histidinol-phosphate aminotransferase